MKNDETNARPKGGLAGIVWLVVACLVLAGLPWMLGSFWGPLIPPALIATPTRYSVVMAAAKTATRNAESVKPSTVVISGSATERMPTYTCPSEASRTGGTIAPGTSFNILGWYEDERGRSWFLTGDDPRQPDKWIQENNSMTIVPADYRPYTPRLTGCP